MRIFDYKYMMFYYKVMRRVRAMMELGPVQLRTYLDKVAILNPVPSGTKVESHPLKNCDCVILNVPESREDLILFIIHGGAFAFGSPRTHRSMASHLCKLTNGTAMLVDYRRTPEHSYPIPLDDCEEAWEFMQNKYPNARYALIGDSAGGNLAASLHERLVRKGLRKPDSMVLMSPWLDLRPHSKSAELNFDRDSVFSREDLISYAGMYASPEVAEDAEVSPLLSTNLKNYSPTLIQATKNELLFPDSREFFEKAKEAGALAKFEIKTNLFHSWQLYPDYIREAKASLESAARFIADPENFEE